MSSDRTPPLDRLDREHLWRPFHLPAAWEAAPIIVSADSCHLVDTAGRRYIDGTAGFTGALHGHSHPRLQRALRDQAARLAHNPVGSRSHAPAIELAHRLAHLAPWGLKRVAWTSGADTAIDLALRMARRHVQSTGAVHRDRFARLGDAHPRQPLLADALSLPVPDEGGEDVARDAALACLETEGDSLAALLVEPLVQLSAGARMHSSAFLRPVLEDARQRGILVVADETIVGLARVGTLFAMEQVGFTPDLLCLGGGLAAGYLPLAATLGTEAIHNACAASRPAGPPPFHDPTGAGHPLAAAIALASLDLFEEEGVVERAVATGRQLTALLDGWSDRDGVARVRQTGMLAAIDLEREPGVPWPAERRMGQRAVHEAWTLGASIQALGDTLVLCPPLSIQPADLTALVRCTGEAIAAARA